VYNFVKKNPHIAANVKEILGLNKKISPDKNVGLHIPSYGAIKCVPENNQKPGFTPGTVEIGTQVLIQLRHNPERWADLVTSGEILAQGRQVI
jgi:hypothetical protein